MEKLIELLDKFRRENKTKELFGEPGTLVPLTGEDFIELNRVMIISKEYEFIKWLVENDKIDLGQKLFNLTKNDSRKSTIYDLDNNDFSWEDTFLMLLSISDTSIEDLISYLK